MILRYFLKPIIFIPFLFRKNMKNNYKGKTFSNLRLESIDSPTIHFANLYVSGENHEWEKNNQILETARKTIKNTIDADEFLRNKDRGKFIIAFPFGYTIYTWGMKQKLIQFL